MVIIALFVINNYLVRPEFFIKADGKGYYDYLPAAFIYNDLNFEYTDTLQTEFYDQKSYTSGYLHTVNGHQINKYFPGVAVLWMPFFAAAHTYALYSDMYAANGYSQPYQESIFYAAVFFLFLGLGKGGLGRVESGWLGVGLYLLNKSGGCEDGIACVCWSCSFLNWNYTVMPL